jgi:hypothetical protein
MSDKPINAYVSPSVKAAAEVLETTAQRLLDRRAVPVIAELAGLSSGEAARLCSAAIMLYEGASTPFVEDGAARSKRIAAALADCGVDPQRAVALFKHVPQMRAALGIA